jgi:hypothetical protein
MRKSRISKPPLPIVGQITGQPVVVYQRIDQAGQKLPIDEPMLADTDTLMVFGLDHMITEQETAPEEIEALKQFLTREGTCLLIGPHHDVGNTQDVRRLICVAPFYSTRGLTSNSPIL